MEIAKCKCEAAQSIYTINRVKGRLDCTDNDQTDVSSQADERKKVWLTKHLAFRVLLLQTQPSLSREPNLLGEKDPLLRVL